MTPPFRVLIADDDAALRLLLSVTLKDDERFDVVGGVEDGREVARRVRDEDVDLLVLDLDLPGLGGIGVLEELGHGERPFVVVLSAEGDAGRERALDAGAAAFLDKAAVAVDLAGAIRDVVVGTLPPRGVV